MIYLSKFCIIQKYNIYINCVYIKSKFMVIYIKNNLFEDFIKLNNILILINNSSLFEFVCDYEFKAAHIYILISKTRKIQFFFIKI